MLPPAEAAHAVRELILEWDGKKGHDRCWYYPELFRKIADIVGVELTQSPELPSEGEFEEGCRRYRLEEYGLQPSNNVV